MKPSVGQIVHYVEHPDSECRAALITDVPDLAQAHVGLCVLGQASISFASAVTHSERVETAGAPDCPDRAAHGDPFRYCACGWREAGYPGNTWHWPERVDE